jgi:hypothetical protein
MKLKCPVYFIISNSASIHPPAVIPSGKSGGRQDSKMIDCSIVLEPDADMARTIDCPLSSPYFDSINHTKYCWLMDWPISVNMKVKRTG